MTYDLSKGHTRSLGVGGGVNKRLAIVAAAVSAAAIGAIWASILEVDPVKLTAPWQVWVWLAIYAFPALAAILGLFLVPLHFMILRPAGHKDITVPVFAVFGAATVAMIAGLVLISGPRAFRDYDVFKLEDDYVRATQNEIGQLQDALRKAGALPILSAEGEGDPMARAERNLSRFNAEVTGRAEAFRLRRVAVRNGIVARYGDTQEGRDRMLLFDRQAAAQDKVITKFWELQTEYGAVVGRYLAVMKRDRGSWRFVNGRLHLYGAYDGALSRAYYDKERLEYDIAIVAGDFGKAPFIDRRIK